MSTPSSVPEEQVKAIQARLDAATPGPWTHRIYMDPGSCRVPSWAIHVVDGPPPSLRFEDAQLIANAPADLAWLLADRASLSRSNEALRKALTEIAADRGSAPPSIRDMARAALAGSPGVSRPQTSAESQSYIDGED